MEHGNEACTVTMGHHSARRGSGAAHLVEGGWPPWLVSAPPGEGAEIRYHRTPCTVGSPRSRPTAQDAALDTCAVVIVLLYEDLYRELLVCGATGVLLVHLGLAKKTASTGGRESVFLRAAVKRAKSMERACSRGLASLLGRVHVIAWRSTRATSPWPCRLANWRASVLWAFAGAAAMKACTVARWPFLAACVRPVRPSGIA